MALTSLRHWLPSSRKQRRESQPEALTVADIDADTGKGPAADVSDCTFHANSEDFLAAVDVQLNDAAPN